MFDGSVCYRVARAHDANKYTSKCAQCHGMDAEIAVVQYHCGAVVVICDTRSLLLKLAHLGSRRSNRWHNDARWKAGANRDSLRRASAYSLHVPRAKRAPAFHRITAKYRSHTCLYSVSRGAHPLPVFYRTPALRGGPFSWRTGRCVIPEKKILR